MGRIHRTVRLQAHNKGDHTTWTATIPADVADQLAFRHGQEVSVRAERLGRTFKVCFVGRLEDDGHE